MDGKDRIRQMYGGQLFPPATAPRFSRLQSARSAELRRRIRRRMAAENIHSDEAYLLVVEEGRPLPGDRDFVADAPAPDLRPRRVGEPAPIPTRADMQARVAAIRELQRKRAEEAVTEDPEQPEDPEDPEPAADPDPEQPE